MGKFFRRQAAYFLTGFVVAFIIYLFIRFSADAVILGVVIGAASGVLTAIAINYIQHRFFPDEAPAPATNVQKKA